jgi:hypothetical protein
MKCCEYGPSSLEPGKKTKKVFFFYVEIKKRRKKIKKMLGLLKTLFVF